MTYEIFVTHPTKAKITKDFRFKRISSCLFGNINTNASMLATKKVRELADIG
jgi:hypothetical protein